MWSLSVVLIAGHLPWQRLEELNTPLASLPFSEQGQPRVTQDWTVGCKQKSDGGSGNVSALLIEGRDEADPFPFPSSRLEQN